eukprot:scaffold33152_cov143-Isochrysis_galbana.AAC.6
MPELSLPTSAGAMPPAEAPQSSPALCLFAGSSPPGLFRFCSVAAASPARLSSGEPVLFWLPPRVVP